MLYYDPNVHTRIVLMPHHTPRHKDVWGNGDIASLIGPGIGSSSVQHYASAKQPPVPTGQEVGWAQRRSASGGDEKSSCP